MTKQGGWTVLDDDITEREARLLEAYGPLEMARMIGTLEDEFAWLETFARVRSKDDSKTFARVNRGALRTIADRCSRMTAALTKARSPIIVGDVQ